MLKKFDRKKYTFESYNIIFDLDLSIYAKMIYMYLCKCADNNSNMSFPSYEDMANKCSCSRRKAIDAVKELAKIKLILKYERRERKICIVKGKEKLIEANTSNLYYVFPEPYTHEDLKVLEEEEQREIVIIPRKDTSFIPKIVEEKNVLSAPHALPLVHDMHSNSKNNLVVVVTSTEVEHLLINYTGRALSKITIEKVNRYIESLGEVIVSTGIEQAIEQNGKTLKYLWKIFDEWIKKGIKTLEDIEEDNMKHDSEKQKLKEKKRSAIENKGKSKPKNDKFVNIQTHDWDMDELEKNADDFMMSQRESSYDATE